MMETATLKSKKPKPIRVMVACHGILFRDGIRKILADRKDIKLVAEVSGKSEVMHHAEEKKPDVILLDIDILELDAVETLRLIREKLTRTKVLLLASDYDEYTIINSIRAGVRGYLTKSATSDQLIKAIQAINSGEIWAERRLLTNILDSFAFSSYRRGRAEESNSLLTKREKTVIKLIAEGQSNKKIARKLFISEKTVKSHLNRIFRKLNIANRVQLALYAKQKGLDNI